MIDGLCNAEDSSMLSLRKPMQVRWKLREVMASRKVTNRKLAKVLGMHETQVSKLKANDFMPRINSERLGLLCKFLKCDLTDLLELADEKEAARLGNIWDEISSRTETYK